MRNKNNERKIARFLLGVFIAISFASTTGCGSNLFVSFANTTEDDALLFEAKQALDQSDFDSAIDFIELMTAAGQVTRDALSVKASAFAGRCGFTFLSFIESLGDSAGGRFFVILMNAMASSTTTERDDCVAATTLLKEIGADAADRTDDENLLMALVSLATMGTIFNTFVDTNNDSSVDGTFNHCSTLDDPNMTRLVVNMGDTLASLTALGSASSIAGDDMASLSAACDNLAAVDPSFDFCSITDESDVTDDHITGMRGVVGSDESIGLGDSQQAGCSAGNTIAECAVACP